MKNILATTAIVLTLLGVSGCSLKAPFKKAESIDDTATVYTYRLNHPGLDGTSYKIYVDGKYAHHYLKANEYFPFHIKEGKVTISAIANGLIEHAIELDLDDDEEYFLRVIPKEGGDFTFEVVNESVALNEIRGTKLSGSTFEENPVEDKVVEEKALTQPQQSTNASDEINKLYDMKEKGIITDAEFQTLKAKVISK
jgi:hypothetical protein